MKAPAPVRIVPASAVGELSRLEPLARRIFGQGDRPSGWFDRKLRRECVDPALSMVAVRDDTHPRDPSGWLGYVLAGAPPSRAGAVRTAGTGMVPSWRGHGIGGRLLEAVADHARRDGHVRVELLAEAQTVPFYRAHGFSLDHATVTLLAFGRATSFRPEPAPPWRPAADDEHEPVAWLPETWAGTEPSARAGLRWSTPAGSATAWISAEGVAWLVQRLVAPKAASWPAPADGLRARLPADAPVLLPLLPADAPSTHELRAAGWSVAQRGALLVRRL